MEPNKNKDGITKFKNKMKVTEQNPPAENEIQFQWDHYSNDKQARQYERMNGGCMYADIPCGCVNGVDDRDSSAQPEDGMESYFNANADSATFQELRSSDTVRMSLSQDQQLRMKAVETEKNSDSTTSPKAFEIDVRNNGISESIHTCKDNTHFRNAESSQSESSKHPRHMQCEAGIRSWNLENDFQNREDIVKTRKETLVCNELPHSCSKIAANVSTPVPGQVMNVPLSHRGNCVVKSLNGNNAKQDNDITCHDDVKSSTSVPCTTKTLSWDPGVGELPLHERQRKKETSKIEDRTLRLYFRSSNSNRVNGDIDTSSSSGSSVSETEIKKVQNSSEMGAKLSEEAQDLSDSLSMSRNSQSSNCDSTGLRSSNQIQIQERTNGVSRNTNASELNPCGNQHSNAPQRRLANYRVVSGSGNMSQSSDQSVSSRCADDLSNNMQTDIITVDDLSNNMQSNIVCVDGLENAATINGDIDDLKASQENVNTQNENSHSDETCCKTVYSDHSSSDNVDSNTVANRPCKKSGNVNTIRTRCQDDGENKHSMANCDTVDTREVNSGTQRAESEKSDADPPCLSLIPTIPPAPTAQSTTPASLPDTTFTNPTLITPASTQFIRTDIQETQHDFGNLSNCDRMENENSENCTRMPSWKLQSPLPITNTEMTPSISNISENLDNVMQGLYCDSEHSNGTESAGQLPIKHEVNFRQNQPNFHETEDSSQTNLYDPVGSIQTNFHEPVRSSQTNSDNVHDLQSPLMDQDATPVKGNEIVNLSANQVESGDDTSIPMPIIDGTRKKIKPEKNVKMEKSPSTENPELHRDGQVDKMSDNLCRRLEKLSLGTEDDVNKPEVFHPRYSGPQSYPPVHNNLNFYEEDDSTCDFIEPDLSRVCNRRFNSAAYRTSYSLSVNQTGLELEENIHNEQEQENIHNERHERLTNADINEMDASTVNDRLHLPGLEKTDSESQAIAPHCLALLPNQPLPSNSPHGNSYQDNLEEDEGIQDQFDNIPEASNYDLDPVKYQNDLNGMIDNPITNSSTSSTYFSPDTDFLDFDFEPSLSTPGDSNGQFGDDYQTGSSDDSEHNRTLLPEHFSQINRLELELNQNVPNNLNDVFAIDPAIDFIDSDSDTGLLNVSRQTSTSNFDNDENSFQIEIPKDEEECYKDVKDEGSEDEAGGAAAPAGWREESLRHMAMANMQLNDEVSEDNADPQDLVPVLPARPRNLLLQFDPSDEEIGNDDRDSSPIYEDIEPPGQNTEVTCAAKDPPAPEVRQQYRRLEDEEMPPDPEQVMVWPQTDAYSHHYGLFGRSPCGPTAVMNVLKTFKISIPLEEVQEVVEMKSRDEDTQLPQYLFSRSEAGTSPDTIVQGVETVTRGEVYGRFFHFFPQREVNLVEWLGDWIQKGAVPVALLNLQRAVPSNLIIPDSWHFQMVYGVGAQGIYLTNPMETITADRVFQQLTSDSNLLVRRGDIIKRWTPDCDLRLFLTHQDSRWRSMNVIGQVVNMIREERTAGIPQFGSQLTSHILIPTLYKPGIILFVKKSKEETYQELLRVPDLPLTPGAVSAQCRKSDTLMLGAHNHSYWHVYSSCTGPGSPASAQLG